MLIKVRDYFDGIERLYRGDNVIEAKAAIKRRIDDTSGECAIGVSVRCKSGDCDNCATIRCEDIEAELEDFAFVYTEDILATL